MNPTNTLGWTLLHFLWQGTLVALLLALAEAGLRKASARARYAAACTAMLLMLACAAATFVWLYPSAPEGVAPAASARTAPQAPAVSAATTAVAPPATDLTSYLPIVVYFWLTGVVILAIRAFGGWALLQHFRRQNAKPAAAAWQQRLLQLARRLEISRPVQLCESALVQVPGVIGWMRPVVLLPASALSGLTPEQLEALLAHELAHIRRHDYLINLLQTTIETLLFYHPAVWWVGQKIRAERENCCDDLAVEVCGNALDYARALAQLESMRHGMPRLAMASNRGPLLNRIQRLIAPPRATDAPQPGWQTAASALFLVLAVCAAPYVTLEHGFSHDLPAIPAPAAPAVAAVAVLQPMPAPPARPVMLARPVPTAPAPAVFPIPAAAPVPASAWPTIFLASQAAPAPAASPAQASTKSAGKGFLAGLEAAGYRDLSVDELISLKNHDVTPEFIAQIKAAGYQPSVEDLVSLRVHEVTPEFLAQVKAAGLNLDLEKVVAFRIHDVNFAAVNEMKALGFNLNADQILAMSVHDLTPELVQTVKQLGIGEPSFDQVLAMKVHDITSEYANSMKQAGLRDLNIDRLLALKIHGATPEQVREITALGFSDLTANDMISLRVHGVTPEFIRAAQSHFKNLTIEKIIQLKNLDIVEEPAFI